MSVEEQLVGGLVDRVVRVGDTIRRLGGPWTPTVHALLRHLEAKGFPAPRARGVDERGRETLSYVEGEPSLWPWPAVLRGETGMHQVGRFLREYHDAVGDFVPPEPAIWQSGAQPLQAGEIVCHGDLNPSNWIWSGEELVGWIDWELAGPGVPLSDLANAAWTAIPLCPDEATVRLGFEWAPRRPARLAALAEAYGETDLESILAAVQRLQAREHARMLEFGNAGREPWRTFLERGLAERTLRDQQWLEAHWLALSAG